MNFYKLAIVLSFIFYLPLFCNTRYFYTTPLSLHLIKDGVYSFIKEAKDTSEKDIINAIKGMIACSDKNQANPKEILKELHNTLDERITRIEYQLRHKQLFNRSDLAKGAVWILAGIGLSVLEYYAYEKWVNPNKDEQTNIKSSIENNGGKITIDNFKNITVKPKKGTTCTAEQQKTFDAQAARLAQLYNSSDNIGPILLLSTSAPIGAFAIGIYKIVSSFKPNTDNHNLDYYKKLLQIVEKCQKDIKSS